MTQISRDHNIVVKAKEGRHGIDERGDKRVAYLIVSEGVTAKRLRGALTLPWFHN